MKKFVVLLMMSVLFTAFSQAQYQGTYNYGDTLRLTVVPQPGWELEGWYNGDELIGEDYTLEYIVTSDMNLVAKMRRIQVTVTVTVEPPNSATITGAGEYDPGAEVHLHIQPRSGYELDRLTVSGLEVPNPYHFIATEDTVVYASLFAKGDPRGMILIASAFVAIILLIISFFSRIAKNRENGRN